MKKFLPLLLTAGIGYFAYKYISKGFAAKKLNIKLRSIRLNPISKASLTLDIINPTNTNININSIVGDVIVNGYSISTINYQNAVSIPANGSIFIELMIKVNPLDAGGFILDLIQKKGKLGKIKVLGSVSGEGIVAPFSIEQNLTA